MDWVEVDIFTTSEGIEPVTGCLLGLGINGFVIKDAKDFEEFLSDKSVNWDYIDDDLMGLKNCETTVTAYLPKNAQGLDYLEAVKAELRALKDRDSESSFGRLEYELKNVREEDWANNWKQYFKPLEIGDKLLIKPSWEPVPEGENRKILEIDPASSFGTGQHNTTQLCLELVEKYLGDGDRVLDLGCGSGILSIGAVLLGAKECTAIDIDANSVKIAGENAEKNKIPAEKYHAICGNVIDDPALVAEIGTGFDMVCANIVADVLIGMSGLFKGFLKKGGRLIVSGIIDMRKDEVLDVIKAQGFVLDEIREKEDWVAASFKAP
ncbi:50S ribosomal protein L11 methyltransferase [Ruminococcus albus]|uniref:Ribosomal protein L11 methyltransferase n=1 Tax=Ruminococcus albus (strain ATCC 27210 / DSM 20455 / JCM 14654 / NCDO 2250 / 7) TaxID=697329 RepID=E6UFT1_RUMA7|nr:50S ribosomal protein L11 methyltransferase [Ruminococcus albus]ADU23070.1 ribosomal protein L11 methyltransferase [Ruminococcus albus 7 = DSM 20455]